MMEYVNGDKYVFICKKDGVTFVSDGPNLLAHFKDLDNPWMEYVYIQDFFSYIILYL